MKTGLTQKHRFTDSCAQLAGCGHAKFVLQDVITVSIPKGGPLVSPWLTTDQDCLMAEHGRLNLSPP